MKPKLTIIGISLVAVAVLTAAYTVGWHNGVTGQEAALIR